MIAHDNVLHSIRKHRLIAILRGISAEQAVEVAEALYRGGIRALEFTFDHSCRDCIEANCRCIRAVREKLPSDLLVGCGTALTPEEAEASVEAGGVFVISPNTDAAVIRRTRELGAVSIPGALTPTEIVSAWNAGADLVKLFPAGELGVGYIRALQGPLGFIPMTAVGGVKPETIGCFLDAGVCGFGVGGELVQKKLLAAHDFDGLTRRAEEFIRAISTWETEHAS